LVSSSFGPDAPRPIDGPIDGPIVRRQVMVVLFFYWNSRLPPDLDS